MEIVMAAHQPNFLPYLGFFDKMMQSDIFVIRDDVQFVARDWHHRNKIRVQGTDSKGNPNSKWINIPVRKEMKTIKEIEINTDERVKNVPWQTYMIRQIKSHYEGSEFFDEYFPMIENIILSEKKYLIDLTMEIIEYLKDSFSIPTRLVRATEMKGFQNGGDASADLVRLCELAQSSTYLSGSGGKNYLDRKKFEEKGIDLRFQEFTHPIYNQRFDGFAPNMGSIDALFNVGRMPGD